MNEENDYNLFPPVDTSGSGNFSEQEFMDWYKSIAAQRGYDPNPYDPEHHYDYRGAYNAGAGYDETGHWPSTFKDKENERRYLSAQDPGWETPPSPHDELRDTSTGKPAPLDLPHMFNFQAPGNNQPELGLEGLPGFLAEETTFPRNTQKTDPLGDNLIMPGDMRYLYEPPKQLPFPLDKIQGINKYLFGDPATRWQQQQDEALNKQKMEKQLKEEELQQRYRDFRKETEDILLQYRKPTDYIDKPDPLLNPYKENDPSVNMGDSLFRSPVPQDLPENYPKLAQGEPSLRGRSYG